MRLVIVSVARLITDGLIAGACVNLRLRLKNVYKDLQFRLSNPSAKSPSLYSAPAFQKS
jgi:hypothetical protein